MTIHINKNITAIAAGIALVLVLSIFETIYPMDWAKPASALPTNTVQLPVVMYHHILKSENRLGDYVISPSQLESDIKHLKEKGYTSVSAAEIIDFVNGGELPEKPVFITFDDGYESVYEYAFPILKKYNFKAAVSVIGKHTDIFSDPNEKMSVTYGHLTWAQIAEMKESGLIEIGNHTYDMHESGGSHRYGIKRMWNESEEEYEKALESDIGMLSQKIEENVGEKPNIFAYPFGAISSEAKPLLAQMGFRVILTCEEKVNELKGGSDEPIVLCRFNRAHSYSTYNFFKKLGIE